MSKKEKVNIVRNQDFESVDDELAQAMSLLDETNERIAHLLSSEAGTVPEEKALADGASAPAELDDGAEASDEPGSRPA